MASVKGTDLPSKEAQGSGSPRWAAEAASSRSAQPKCEEHRQVRLFLAREGDDLVIDGDRADDQGEWKIRITEHVDFYKDKSFHAVAERKEIRREGNVNTDVCVPTRSETIKADG